MNTENYSKAESITSSTVNSVQKHQIIEAILSSIKITPYYDGLELKACKAISEINKYSDAEITEELINKETGDKYKKINNL